MFERICCLVVVPFVVDKHNNCHLPLNPSHTHSDEFSYTKVQDVVINTSGTNRKDHPMIEPRDQYDHHTLRRPCHRACHRAGVEVFAPYDLRRSMATTARATLGKEAAMVLLGHASTSTTEIYLLEEVQEAVKVAKALSA